MQRILHVVGKMDRAGAETMLMNLYRHIDRNQIQFDFITFTNETGDYDAEIIQLGGRIIPILADNPITRVLKFTMFLKDNPDYKIVHAHTSLSNAFHLLAAKHAGIKYRISHSHNSRNDKSGIVNELYEKWALITNRRVATYKIGCGQLAAEYLFGTTNDVLLLPNAVDIEGMNTIAKNSQNYIKNEFHDEGLKIIQVGRLTKVKNHQFSLKIAEELMNRQVDFTLYIVGQGALGDQLKKDMQDRLLINNVKFLGVRSDITELMAGADYMIMPSFHEGFPVVLVESQTVGLPTIVSDKVSTEVDIGLGLIDFLPIDSVKDWVDLLLTNKKKKVTDQEITSTLKAKGYDVLSNAKKLIDIYNRF